MIDRACFLKWANRAEKLPFMIITDKKHNLKVYCTQRIVTIYETTSLYFQNSLYLRNNGIKVMNYLEFRNKWYDQGIVNSNQIYSWKPGFDKNNLTRWTQKRWLYSN